MKTGIISLGLIGGSLLKSLSAKNKDIIAVTRNKTAIEAAKAYTEHVSDDITTLKDCDIVFVCSPMNKTLEILDRLETIVKPSTIVADVCSLKEFVMQKQRPYIFIGTHPMAGTENSGFDASFEELFNGAKWVITPHKNTPQTAINKLSDIITLTGANIIFADAKEHDMAAALISHMPMLVSQAIMKTAQNNRLALQIAASGFRDMTRLSMSNTQMAEDMVSFNKENIQTALNTLDENIKNLLKEDYLQQITDIKQKRSKMYNNEGKNIYNQSCK